MTNRINSGFAASRLVRRLAGFAGAALALAAVPAAHAGVSWAVGVNMPGVHVGVGAPQRVVYVQPQPYYRPAAPVYVQPQVVYQQPVYAQPVYPQTVYQQPVYQQAYPPVVYAPAPVYRGGWGHGYGHHHHGYGGEWR